MSNMHIDSVLAQIRSLSAQVKAPQAKPADADAASPAGASAFATLLKQGVEQVNSAQQSADRMATAFQRGTPGVDLAQVMIESQKASVAFRAATEVRNRMVNAYQDIMNMQI